MTLVELKTVPPETVAYVAMHGPYSQIPEAMNRLYGWTALHGLEPAGMPSGVYYDDPKVVGPDEANWEVRTPVANNVPDSVPDSSNSGTKHVDSRLVAFAMHRGPYETIAETYDDLMTWVAANGYRIVGPFEELYYSDPNTTQPADYLTEIRIPVAAGRPAS